MGFLDRLGSVNKRIAAGLTGTKTYKIHIYKKGKVYRAYIPSTAGTKEINEVSEDALMATAIDKMKPLNIYESIKLSKDEMGKRGVEYLGTLRAKR